MNFSCCLLTRWIVRSCLSMLVCCLATTVSASGVTQIEMGFDLSHMSYEETVPDQAGFDEQFFMRDYGFFAGVNASLAYYGALFLKLDAQYKAGQIHYESCRTGSANGIHDYVFGYRGLVGFCMCSRNGTRITPYTGLGYRYLFDRSSEKHTTQSSTVFHGYDRESNYLYSPLGVELNRRFDAHWTVGLVGEFDYLWRGFQESHLEQVSAYFPVVNKQDTGWGARISLRMIRCDVSDRQMVLEPYFRHWNIDRSEYSAAYIGSHFARLGNEPHNTTNEFGFKFSWVFESAC